MAQIVPIAATTIFMNCGDPNPKKKKNQVWIFG